MTFSRVRDWSFPQDLDSTEKVQDFLRIWYEELKLESIDRIADMGSLGLSGLTTGYVVFPIASSVVTGSVNLFWDNTNSRLSINVGTSPSVSLDVLGDTSLDGAVTLNTSAADKDFLVKGDTDTGLFLVDASTNRVGISCVPSTTFENSGTFKSSGGTISLDNAVTINTSEADVDFRVAGNTATNLLFVDASTDRIGIGTTTPSHKLHIDGTGLDHIEASLLVAGGTNQFIQVDSASWARMIIDSHDADAQLEFQEDDTNIWVMGFDYTDSNKFKIGEGNLGTNTRFTMETGGATTFASSVTSTSFIIGANTLDTNEWAYLDGQDQALKTTDGVQFANINLISAGAYCQVDSSTTARFIADSSGADAFVDFQLANTTKWTVGFDNTDSNAYLISEGTPGTNTRFKIASGGAVTIGGTLSIGEITVIDGSGINLQEDITFTGATTENLIKMPDNLADALSIQEGSNKYVTFDTVNDEEDIFLYKSVDILHTSTHAGDHTLEIDADAAGYGDIKAIDIDYITGPISAGEDEAVILINIDEISATGGEVFGLEVLATDQLTGSTGLHGLKVGPLIAPIHQDSGTFINPTFASDDTPTTDVPVMRDGLIANTTAIFDADDDYIIIGAAAAFQDMELIFATASSKDIKPTFWYSINGGSNNFAQFTPVDGTDGCRHTGVISWDASDLSNHVADGTTGTFNIKIIRTKGGSFTTPILGYAKTASTTEYTWDKNGDVNIRNLSAGSMTVDSTAVKSVATYIVAASDSRGKNAADYTCDGTADDVEIQAAIDALPASGGTVYLLEGTYTMAATVTIPDYTTLTGSGPGTLINWDVTQNIGFTNVDNPAANHHIVISDMLMDGFDKTNDLIEFGGAYACTFKNLWLTRGNHDGIELAACYNCTLENIVSHDHNVYNGIEIEDSYNCVVINPICYNNTLAGIEFDAASHDNTVIGGILYDNTVNGILFSGSADDNVAIGVVMYGNGTADIHYSVGGINNESYGCLLKSATPFTFGGVDDIVIGRHLKNCKARAYLDANQLNLVSGNWTKVALNNEGGARSYDPGGNFDTTVNYRYIAPYPGYYTFHGSVRFRAVVVDKLYSVALYKQGAIAAHTHVHSALADVISANVSDTIYLTAGQFVELYVKSAAGVDTVDVEGTEDSTYLTVDITTF